MLTHHHLRVVDDVDAEQSGAEASYDEATELIPEEERANDAANREYNWERKVLIIIFVSMRRFW